MEQNQYQVEVDAVSSSEWSQLMELFEDANIYQTWAYGAVRWGARHLSHLVLKRNNEVVAMAQLRIVGLSKLKCGIAYLRWGPLCHLRGRELEADVVQRMARALRNEYVEGRKLCLRILPNAFTGSLRAQVFGTAFSQFSSESASHANGYRTFVLDLAPSLDELRKRLDRKWRNHLSRAEKNGLTIVEGEGLPEYQVFVDMYKEMWARKRFETSVDVDEFRRIQEGLTGSQRMRILICRQGDTPVAGIVCSAMGDTANCLLAATSDAGLQFKGAYLLQWTMIGWLKEHGFRYYDLGGIDPVTNPGVYRFKSGFSGNDVSHMTPFVACDSLLGFAFLKAVDFVRLWRRDGDRHAVQSRPQPMESERLPGTEPVR
jgi:lipid II:glycine glycyltransferase (peptidoglycan interpeptide bridge formation enzyme)